MRTSRPAILSLIVACGLAAPWGGSAAADVTFTPVALTGQQAPGQAPGVTFRFLSDGRLGNGGQVAFWAELGGPGITAVNDGSIWLNTGRALQLVVQEGDPVPGLVDTVFAAFPRHAFNGGGAAGELAFPGVLVPANQTSVPINVGIFVRGSGGVEMVAREGEQAAGLPAGTNYAGFTALSLTPGGEAIWQGNAGAAAWTASASAGAGTIAARGTAAPGAGAATFDYIDLPATAAGGVPAFRATTLQGTTRGMGLWAAAGGAPVLVALAGNQAPGAPGVVLDHLSMGPVSCAGGPGDCIAFWSRLDGAGVTAENDGAIFAGSAAAPMLLAREGDAAPGTTAVFGWLSPQIAINAEGRLAFLATLAGPGITASNNSAVYIATGSSVQLVAREGEPAPGLSAGVEFANFDAPILNDSGDVVFIAHLRGGNTTATSGRALYFRGSDGTLVPLVRTGELFETGAGEKTIEEILLDHDPAAGAGGGHSGFAATSAGALLLVKLHFKDPGPNNTVLRASGLFTAAVAGACYANCDGSTIPPVLNVADFGCFLQKFAAGDPYANCDGSTIPPVLNVADFGCFLQRFAAGCE